MANSPVLNIVAFSVTTSFTCQLIPFLPAAASIIVPPACRRPSKASPSIGCQFFMVTVLLFSSSISPYFH